MLTLIVSSYLWWTIFVGIVFTAFGNVSFLTISALGIILSLSTAFSEKALFLSYFSIYGFELDYLTVLKVVFSAIVFAITKRLLIELYFHFSRISDVVRGSQFSDQVLGVVSRDQSFFERVVPLFAFYLFLESGFLLECLGQHLSNLAMVLPEAKDKGQFTEEGILSALGGLMEVAAFSVASSIKMAVPVLFVLLSFDLVVAYFSRHITSFNVSFELISVRSVLGYVITCFVILGWIL